MKWLNKLIDFAPMIMLLLIGFIWNFCASMFIDYAKYNQTMGVYFIYTCVIAPFGEELLFREIPLKFTRRFAPEMVFQMVIFTSIIFGFVHQFNWNSVLLQGFTGFIFALIYLRYNYSYIAAVIAHSIWNTTVMLLYYPR